MQKMNEKTESYRDLLYQQQTELRQIMANPDQFDEAVRLFFRQHAMLHSASIAQPKLWSFEDAILNDVSEEQFRRIPSKGEHSMAWCIWHIARIEDITMNRLVAGSPEIFQEDGWPEQMKAAIRHSGNAMDAESVAELSASLDLEALRAYRLAVGLRTREIVKGLGPQDLKQKVDSRRLQSVQDAGSVVEAASEVLDYWSRRDIAGLLLMPATRHNLIHLNEAMLLSQKP